MSTDTLDSSLEAIRDYEGVPLIGTVIQNVDPLNLSRIQVRIDGLYDPDLGPVPWAGPLKQSQFGISDSWGVYGSPAIGSDVVVYLQNGDPHFPVYQSIQRNPNPEYPSGTSWGFTDPVGNKVKFDLESKEVTFTTNDNIVFFTDGAGNLRITVPGTTTVISEDKLTLESEADIQITSATNVNIEAAGDIGLTAAGNVTIDATVLNVTANSNFVGPVDIQGNQTSTGTVLNNGKNIGSIHFHTAQGSTANTTTAKP